jgi:COP9 signalosome complex subunit 3
MKPIRSAIFRLDPSASLLTSTHLYLVKLALETRKYEEALPVLDKYIFQFPGAPHHPKPAFLCEQGLPPAAYITYESKLTSKLKYQDVLEYFLYSGMVYIGLRRWENALECLENAITYPTRDASKIMVEAYKKWVLVGLLLEGKLLSLPRYTGSGAAKIYHTLAKPYEAVAQIFESGTAGRLKSEIEVGQKIWQEDCNTGLIINILSCYQKFQIRNLAGVYSKISIPEVNHLTTSAETGSRLQSPQLAEQLVRSMIAEGSLNATLSHPPTGPAILTFSPGGPKLSEVQIENELQASKQRIQTLTAEIKRTDRMLTYDNNYLRFVEKQKKNAKNDAADQGIAGPDMDWNSMEDEDIMAGMTY